MYHKDVIVVMNRHDGCGVPLGMPEMCVDTEFCPVPRAHEQAGRVHSMELEIHLADDFNHIYGHCIYQNKISRDP